MRYRKLTTDGDYTFGQNKQGFYIDGDAVGQAVKTKLRLIKGEWWENTDLGLPLFTDILGQPGTQDALEAVRLLITNEIFIAEGVQAIVDFVAVLDHETRLYSATCTVETIYGQVTVEVTL